MDWLFLKGVAVGFAIAAPVGPIGILCISRTLTEGRPIGIVSGLGAASADALYGCIAALGLTVVANFLTGHLIALRFLGGAVLLGLGVRIFLSKPKEQQTEGVKRGFVMAFVSTFLLTLTNPLTLMSFAVIFVALGLERMQQDPSSGAYLIGGVFAGSAGWWMLLSLSVGVFRARLTQRGLLLINRISGGILIGFGVFAAASTLA